MAAALANPLEFENAGERMLKLASDLFPLHRSITGAGLRETLRRLSLEIPLTIHEVSSGSPVFDFEIPLEWQIRDAYVADSRNRRVIDYRDSNLHVVNGSQGVRRSMTWSELEPYLHSLPGQPDCIPYRTAFFREEWGFCLRDADRTRLAKQGANERYDVLIDAEHRPGSLSYGECFLPGETEEEVLFWAHACHPSLANDNLSGIVVTVRLAQALAQRSPRKYGYRFVFAPATIGALAWLSRNTQTVKRIAHGLVLAQLGDDSPLTYKHSQRQNAAIDSLAVRALRLRGKAFAVRDFQPWGYDERQFCSPGFDLPMGRLTRAADGEYAQYHTSDDNLGLLSPGSLTDSLACLLEITDLIESNTVYRNTSPCGEPQLGRRGLYAGYGRATNSRELQQAVQWLLNQSDGRRGILEIVERSRIELDIVQTAVELLRKHKLLEPV